MIRLPTLRCMSPLVRYHCVVNFIQCCVTSNNVAVGKTVINWIESKALFANESSHKKYSDEQLLSYYNRSVNCVNCLHSIVPLKKFDY